MSLAAAIDRDGDLALPDVAFTLTRRPAHEVRLAAVVADRADACAVLTAADSAADSAKVAVSHCPAAGKAGANRVAFLFPGQGSQHPGMARDLYDSEPVFGDAFDRCAAGFAAELGVDLKAEVFGGTGALESTDLAQPALFAVEYALAQLVMSYSVTPAALAGHSIGELVAATVAGVFDLPTAIKVVATRARLMHAAPPGAMVAVAAGPADIGAHLTGDVDVAAVNEVGSCVVAGPA